MRSRILPLLLLAFVTSLAAQSVTTFGPKQYMRSPGAPQTFTDTFSRCANNCQLVVVNGNPNGSNRVSSASVYLNGIRILGPSDFNQNVGRIVRPVPLGDSDQLMVSLSSKPGSFLTISVECSSFAALTIANPPGVTSSIWSNGTVSLAIPLQNLGDTPANNLTITGMQVMGSTYAGPTAFPYPAGNLDPLEIEQIFAEFTGVSLPFPLTVSGTYMVGGSTCPFQAQGTVTPPPPGNGGQPKLTTVAPTFNANTGIYLPPLPHPPDDEPNPENNYVPPIGMPRYLFPSPPAASILNNVLGFNPSDMPPPSGNANDVVFLRNQNGGGYGALPPDPSVAGATAGGFAMISANTAVSYSTDFGKTFKTVNLTSGSGFTDPAIPTRTDFFPQSDGGLCCDQVLHYVPSKNLLVWLLQYWSPSINNGGLTQKGQNRLRIAFATPEAAKADFLHAWSWFDITPSLLGDTTNTDWFDYPDLAFSNDWLYISVDHGLWNANKNSQGNVIGQQVYTGRRWFIRASLNDMAGSSGFINLVYYEAQKGGVWKAHFAQGAPDTMYYAAQPDTSTLSVFADPDSSPNIPSPKDLGVTSFCKGTSTNPCDFQVLAPDSLDWNVAPHAVIGATYVDTGVFCPPGGCSGTRHVYFAFDGGRNTGGGRNYPYVRIEKVNPDNVSIESELDIWNPDYAFATAGLNSRPGTGKDEVAISLATGGGGSYADNAVGFLGDFVVYLTTSSNVTQYNGNVTRYGDYFDVRNVFSDPIQCPAGESSVQGVGYSTLGYSITQATAGQSCPVGGCNVGLQYVIFGRNGDVFPSCVEIPR